MKLKYLKDGWDNKTVAKLTEPEILRYRSNLLGSDLRITNFGGGNTSSKILQKDPITNELVEVLWVKGSGGDLKSIKVDGFARLYMDKFLQLKNKYKGKDFEDEMVNYYPMCGFGQSTRPASIDTPLHGLIPFKHVDHLHSDWATALAAAANGQRLLKEFNKKFNKNLFWIPWQRPGYELGVMLQKALKLNPKAEGAIMASHGLITWANGQYECYRNSIEVIDALGQFVLNKVRSKGTKLFGGEKFKQLKKQKEILNQIIPFIRGSVSQERQMIADFTNTKEVTRFINSNDGKKLAYQGTSCPDHFLRTKIRPFYVEWNPTKDSIEELKNSIAKGLKNYRTDYEKYYNQNKEKNSPKMRDANPKIVLIPGLGMLSFGKDKKEARISGEFFVNAIHVMEGATALAGGKFDKGVNKKRVVNNYLALTPNEAFRIEYWALEEAKLQRQPAEKEMSRKIVIVVGGGSGVGKEFCKKLVKEGAHIVIADMNMKAAKETQELIEKVFGKEKSVVTYVDITKRKSVTQMLEIAINSFGGVDTLINTAAIFLPPDKGTTYKDETWNKILNINITGNNILSEEFSKIVTLQNTDAEILLTSSANAVVPKFGSEPYDVSKSAVNHLVRELSIRYSPNIRVNAVSPATVVEGSAMFPRDRVIASLSKYKIKFDKKEKTSTLVNRLAEFYAQRTLTHRPIRPIDVVEAGYFLISKKSNRTTGHIIPVDGGLTEAFLR